MADLILDLGNSANWQQVDARSLAVTEEEEFRYRPIPGFTVGHLFTSRVTAIATAAPPGTYKPHWWYAGRVVRVADLGFSPMLGAAIPTELGFQPAQLNAAKLLIWGGEVETYRLKFQPPWWLRRLDFEVFEYTGPVSREEIEQLQVVQINQLRIEAKIDALRAEP